MELQDDVKRNRRRTGQENENFGFDYPDPSPKIDKTSAAAKELTNKMLAGFQDVSDALSSQDAKIEEVRRQIRSKTNTSPT